MVWVSDVEEQSIGQGLGMAATGREPAHANGCQAFPIQGDSASGIYTSTHVPTVLIDLMSRPRAATSVATSAWNLPAGQGAGACRLGNTAHAGFGRDNHTCWH